jgi:hypothetical protein
MAGDKDGLVDIIRASYRLVSEAEVGNGDAAGLFRVVLEVGLDILVGMVPDDLYRVFVGADGSVAAQAPELAFDRSRRGGIGRNFLRQGKPVTSSTIPMVNWRLGLSFVSSLYTANTLEGGVSFEPRP